jgi:DNA-directed RNA polymerase specialized sigma24 family protein
MHRCESNEIGSKRNGLEELLRQAQNGNAGAAQELFDNYAKHFLTVIRRRIARRLRTVFDSADFLQEARIALFSGNLQGQCKSVESFLAFLTKVAENHVLKANRKYLDCQSRNLNREVPLEQISEDDEPSAPRCSPFGRAMEKDEWDRLLKNQPLDRRQLPFPISDN